MEKRRFFVDKEAIVGNNATLYDDERNHLVNVLRMGVGDEVILGCGDGFDYFSKIVLIEKQYVMFEILKKTVNPAEPKKRLDVFQAIAKGEKMDMITQKITELGARKLVPFVSNFTIAKESSIKIERLKKISQEAMKQCRRSNSLLIENAIKFDEMLERIGSYDLVIFAYENETVGKLGTHFQNLDAINSVAVIVGAEGGFSDEEANKIIQAGAQSVSIGERTLRCETAAIVLTALVMYELKEMN